MKNIRESVDLVDGGWLFDNIEWRIGDGFSTLFWIDPWLYGMSLKVRFNRLFDLEENKRETIVEMKE